MNNFPSILVVSCSNTKPKSIIKLITKENPQEDSTGLVIQPWSIDTKYYTAEVNIIGLTESYQRNSTFNEQVEAVIIHLDTNKTTGLEDLKSWESLESDCQPEIKLLICNYCNESTKISVDEATAWCLKRGYEFIELYPLNTQKNTEDDNLIEEKFGVERIIEALQAHTWSNLIMKKSNANKHSSEIESNANQQKLNISDELEDSFIELYSQLTTMKTNLQSISTSQRKQCAEELVTAFWKAIGGDEEEISDL